MHKFGKTGCGVQMNFRAQRSSAASQQLRRWPKNICCWQWAEHILFLQKAIGQICLECSSPTDLNVFTRSKFLQAQREQKVRGEAEEKRRMVFKLHSLGGLALGFVYLSFFLVCFVLLCFKMKKRKCIKILSMDHQRCFVLFCFPLSLL